MRKAKPLIGYPPRVSQGVVHQRPVVVHLGSLTRSFARGLWSLKGVVHNESHPGISQDTVHHGSLWGATTAGTLKKDSTGKTVRIQ